jgi:hypothetical protein
VADDDRERARVHEIDTGQVKHDLLMTPASLRQGLIQLPARDNVKVTDSLNHADSILGLPRKLEFFHRQPHARTGPVIRERLIMHAAASRRAPVMYIVS